MTHTAQGPGSQF